MSKVVHLKVRSGLRSGQRLHYGVDPVFPARDWWRAAFVVLIVVWFVAWLWMEMSE